MAISAAIRTCLGVPPCNAVRPPAAIADDTPISAWQPPIAAEMVARFLKMQPISPDVSINFMMSLFPNVSQKQLWYKRTAGITPEAPFVGEVTIRPIEAFSSFTASAKQLTH